MYIRGDNLVIERQKDDSYKVLRRANKLGQFTKDCIYAIVLAEQDGYVYVIRDDSKLIIDGPMATIHVTSIKLE